jgi:hypothetical protein
MGPWSDFCEQRTLTFKIVHRSLPSGPEGIRTPDLLSAIEARSQLRYRPVNKAKVILPEAGGDVKKWAGEFYRFTVHC